MLHNGRDVPLSDPRDGEIEAAAELLAKAASWLRHINDPAAVRLAEQCALFASRYPLGTVEALDAEGSR